MNVDQIICKAACKYSRLVYESFIEAFPCDSKEAKQQIRQVFDLNKRLPEDAWFLDVDMVSLCSFHLTEIRVARCSPSIHVCCNYFDP